MGQVFIGVHTIMAEQNPAITIDVLIELLDKPHHPIVLIERKNEPVGWAIPGGFIKTGESAETAAVREAKEEVGLDVDLIEQFQVYSDPKRDPREHVISIVFVATAKGNVNPGEDEAKGIKAFESWNLPDNLCFDHQRILKDYWRYRHYGIRPLLSN